MCVSAPSAEEQAASTPSSSADREERASALEATTIAPARQETRTGRGLADLLRRSLQPRARPQQGIERQDTGRSIADLLQRSHLSPCSREVVNPPEHDAEALAGSSESSVGEKVAAESKDDARMEANLHAQEAAVDGERVEAPQEGAAQREERACSAADKVAPLKLSRSPEQPSIPTCSPAQKRQSSSDANPCEVSGGSPRSASSQQVALQDRARAAPVPRPPLRAPVNESPRGSKISRTRARLRALKPARSSGTRGGDALSPFKVLRAGTKSEEQTAQRRVRLRALRQRTAPGFAPALLSPAAPGRTGPAAKYKPMQSRAAKAGRRKGK